MDYYNQSIEEIYKYLSSSKKGLTDNQTKQKLEKEGLNEINTQTQIKPLKILIEQFKDTTIYILLFAIFFSLLIGHLTDSLIILIIILINATIGFIQELKAKRSLEALKKMTIIKANVKRNNKFKVIDSKKLVLGDIVFLEAGDKVPADIRIIEQTKLKVDESTLTGESVPVEKTNTTINKNVQIADQKNMLFFSTNITEGKVLGIVVKKAMNTEIGKITSLIKDAEDEVTPLQRRLDKFGIQLGKIVIAICLVVFVTEFIRIYLSNTLNVTGIISILFVAISLAVAAVPTAMPAVVTIALSLGVKSLLSKRVLVKKLKAVETLGSCNVICTDKTGTLTKNEMTVKKVWTYDKESDVLGNGYNPEGKINERINSMLFRIGLMCNNANIYKKDNKWMITGDPTEAAFIVSATKAKIKKDQEIIDELPFDSDRKLMSVLTEDNFVYTKGATDQLLQKCQYILIDNQEIELTTEHKNKILRKNKEYAQEAMRVLGFAYKKINSKTAFKEENLVFVGMQAMIDPPRNEVIDALKKTKIAGIRTIMITGDHKLTASAIANNIGIKGNALTGEDISNMDDKQLTTALKNNTNIFARVIPEHKQRIVNCLQSLNCTVAMTGDGVNDAPALKKSNIGVAVGSGTDVAKEASDIVLLDDSFAHIVSAVEEGRGIYDNIQKSIMLLLSGNIGEVLIVFIAALFGLNLPLTAVLLLWINLVTDGAPALAYSVDPYGKNIMKKKPRPFNEGILPKQKRNLIFTLGIIGTAIALFMFNKYASVNLEYARTLVFNFVVLYELILVYIIRSNFEVRIFSNRWLYGAVILSILLQVLIMYTPLNSYFGIVGLDFKGLFTLLKAGMIFAFFSYIYSKYMNKKF